MRAMDFYEKLKQYEHIQVEVLGEIISALNVRNLEGLNEEELWEFDQRLNSGWNVFPHGEHLSCENTSEKIEIPLYVPGCTGIDPGHFDEYLQSTGLKSLGYLKVATLLESLEKEGRAKKINPENTSDVWKLC